MGSGGLSAAIPKSSLAPSTSETTRLCPSRDNFNSTHHTHAVQHTYFDGALNCASRPEEEDMDLPQDHIKAIDQLRTRLSQLSTSLNLLLHHLESQRAPPAW